MDMTLIESVGEEQSEFFRTISITEPKGMGRSREENSQKLT